MTEPNDEELIAWMRKVMGDECLAADRLEALRAERDALDRQLDGARGCLAEQTSRAEKAEAENARLREAGVRFCDDFVSRFSEPLTDPERGMLRAAAELRAALAPVESKGGDDGR
ncbi:MAG: hypothetical protein ING29_13185 [Azospirillum sp.]|nr:hypothetical protein [Azospirillum sp.]